MTLDPRTPVLVGGGQTESRDGSREPLDLLVAAARAAGADAGASALLGAVTSVRVVGMLSWAYPDPGRLVGAALGADVRHTVLTGMGGSHPQALVNDAAEDVAAGRADVVLVGGAEAWRTRMALGKEGREPDWTTQPDGTAPDEGRPDVPMRAAEEGRSGLDRPVHVYPLFEQALRLAAGRGLAEHRAAVGALWSAFSDVAADNPHAWIRQRRTADEITTPGPDNRLVTWPYTKLMTSNSMVDQGAAVLVCSVAAAERYAVPRDRWVFPLAGAEAADTASIAARPRLDGSPAIRHTVAAALAAAGVGPDDLGPVDLYSCFPSAVQVAAREIGLPTDDPARPLTVTGGLTFAGGPWNNYSTHAIATLLGRLREEGGVGLVTANSGHLTKHAAGVYATTPSPGGFARPAVQHLVDAEPATPLADPAYDGPAALEAWVVPHDRDGQPERALAALRLPDGSRALAASPDPDDVARLLVEEHPGKSATVHRDATFTLR